MFKILVVDDDRALTRALGVRLQSAGFEVVCCHSADDATEAVMRERPQVIILDVDMPCYSGPEFHHCLKFADRTRHIPVIYLSGHDTDSNRRVASEQGAVAFLTKPYDADELIRTIRSVALAAGT